LVVSHDREFLDNVATSTLSIGPDGVVEDFVGGWSDWRRQHDERLAREAAAQKKSGTAGRKVTEPIEAPVKRKLSFKEQKEREVLPKKIEELETAIAKGVEAMGLPGYYKQGPAELAAANAKQAALDAELATAYKRWEDLENFE
jgi:ATP-binding cassette subfamily F protein uup